MNKILELLGLATTIALGVAMAPYIAWIIGAYIVGYLGFLLWIDVMSQSEK